MSVTVHRPSRAAHAAISARHLTSPSVRASLRQASGSARALVISTTFAALVLPIVAADGHTISVTVSSGVLALIFVISSVVGVEFGRWLEGRTTVEQRPHKALSVWAFATAMTLPPHWLLAVVPLSYAHAYWRGLRPPAWKWVGSAAFVMLAAVAAHEVIVVADLPDKTVLGPRAFVAVVMAIVVFLAVESGLFLLISRVNHPDQEVWLRATMSSRSFYATEASMLGVGALAGLVWGSQPWLGVLLLPVYVLVQRAALFDPLRTEASTDDKTGLLRFETWRTSAVRELDRLGRTAESWAVMLVDLDHFKQYNDDHGHVAGDIALVKCAASMQLTLRRSDVTARFGGEEFVALLSSTSLHDVSEIAERLRVALREAASPPVTASIGVAWVSESTNLAELRHALVEADRALYEAKNGGRDRVVVHELVVDSPALVA